MKKAIIYTRAKANLADFSLVSTTVQALSCKKFAKENGIQIVGLYTDIRLLGTNPDYPAWKSILRTRKQNFNTVLIYEPARIGRNCKQSRKDRLRLQEKGIHIISIADPLSDENDEFLDMVDAIERRLKHDGK